MAIAQLIRSGSNPTSKPVESLALAQNKNIHLTNKQDSAMIESWLDKCDSLVDYFQSAPSEAEEKQLVRELKAKGGWYSELSPKRINDMCAAHHWCNRATNEINFDFRWFTFSAFQKFISLRDGVKWKIWEVWSEEDCELSGEIITIPLLKKLKDMATCRLSELKMIADLASEMEGKGGLIARKVVAQVTELIEKSDESSKEELLAIASDASEGVNLDDKESLESFRFKVTAAEEMLANRMAPEVIKEAIASGCVEPTGTTLKALAKFNQNLANAKKFGESCISSFSQISGEAKKEIKHRLKYLGDIQLALNFNIA